MRIVFGAALVGIVAICLWWYFAPDTIITHRDDTTATPTMHTGGHEESPPEPVSQNQGASIGEENTVNFTCTDHKSFTAVFMRDIVALTLSDGRQIELRQAISGSGIRYLNNTQTIEFRGKGLDASLAENGATTYSDCKADHI